MARPAGRCRDHRTKPRWPHDGVAIQASGLAERSADICDLLLYAGIDDMTWIIRGGMRGRQMSHSKLIVSQEMHNSHAAKASPTTTSMRTAALMNARRQRSLFACDIRFYLQDAIPCWENIHPRYCRGDQEQKRKLLKAALPYRRPVYKIDQN